MKNRSHIAHPPARPPTRTQSHRSQRFMSPISVVAACHTSPTSGPPPRSIWPSMSYSAVFPERPSCSHSFSSQQQRRRRRRQRSHHERPRRDAQYTSFPHIPRQVRLAQDGLGSTKDLHAEKKKLVAAIDRCRSAPTNRHCNNHHYHYHHPPPPASSSRWSFVPPPCAGVVNESPL